MKRHKFFLIGLLMAFGPAYGDEPTDEEQQFKESIDEHQRQVTDTLMNVQPMSAECALWTQYIVTNNINEVPCAGMSRPQPAGCSFPPGHRCLTFGQLEQKKIQEIEEYIQRQNGGQQSQEVTQEIKDFFNPSQ